MFLGLLSLFLLALRVCAITITYPDVNTVWTQGESHTVEWTYDPDDPPNITTQLLDAGGKTITWYGGHTLTSDRAWDVFVGDNLNPPSLQVIFWNGNDQESTYIAKSPFFSLVAKPGSTSTNPPSASTPPPTSARPETPTPSPSPSPTPQPARTSSDPPPAPKPSPSPSPSPSPPPPPSPSPSPSSSPSPSPSPSSAAHSPKPSSPAPTSTPAPTPMSLARSSSKPLVSAGSATPSLSAVPSSSSPFLLSAASLSGLSSSSSQSTASSVSSTETPVDGAFFKKSINTGAIAGGVVGGVVALALFGLAGWLVLRRLRNRNHPAPGSPEPSTLLMSEESSTMKPSNTSTWTAPAKLYNPADPTTFPPPMSPTGYGPSDTQPFSNSDGSVRTLTAPGGYRGYAEPV